MMMLSPVINQLHRVAFHEAGHAAACARNNDCTKILLVTAAAGVDANGMHYHGKTDIRARPLYNQNQLFAHLEYYIGSIVAEIAFFGSFYGRGAQCDLTFAHLAAELIVCFLEDDGSQRVEFDFKKRCELPRRLLPEIEERIGQYVMETEDRLFAAYENKNFKDRVGELALNVYNAEDKTLYGPEIYRILNERKD
ncbi:hypothetical protein niasHS_018076 [Heterodera schachtii]|uniref:Peptidase M41 domain-containing protein n=1 Tax=Heterodera schachtii TaxID=97005 RepID=A0ABD2HRS0_HETSC